MVRIRCLLYGLAAVKYRKRGDEYRGKMRHRGLGISTHRVHKR